MVFLRKVKQAIPSSFRKLDTLYYETVCPI
uniref:Uncharacterized protein n=1 Tax=Siphoviridae sp. ctWWc42 TaxID=2826361 RepID=A0A8S5R1A1_9CAUD|nr:MAG TPA: hypothetical protein [Siphoviridae sp. ctWWc42]